MKRNVDCLWGICLGILIVFASVVSVHAEVLPYQVDSLKIEKVFNTTQPLGDIAQSPGDDVWVLESTGIIRVFDGGMMAATTTLPVSSCSGDASSQGGLLDVAFDPAYGSSGLAFIYYVDGTNHARIDRIYRSGGDLTLGTTLADFGVTPGGCRAGGGMKMGDDGWLYVSVGDLEVQANAQEDLVVSPAGKVLRVKPDGTETQEWARGFRNGEDLAINDGGTVYVTEVGLSPNVVDDEVNAAAQGGNYGWPSYSGDDGGDPLYDDPLVSYLPTVKTEALEVIGAGLGGQSQSSLAYACVDQDEVRQAFLTGVGMTQFDSARPFYDPDGDRDGSPDAGCPGVVDSLAYGADGSLYAGNSGANPGIWRVWQDKPGPREVSGPGAPVHLTMNKAAFGKVDFGYENLTDLDAAKPDRNAGQHDKNYQVWEGTLPIIDGAYDHTSLLVFDGFVNEPGHRTWGVRPGTENHYYLISAQNDNMEGSLGKASDGTERPGSYDYCDDKGWGTGVPLNPQKCAEKWVDPRDGVTELRLRDYNPSSPTYLEYLTMSDFRGKVVKMDISANNCYWCGVMANFHHAIDVKFRDRDVILVTVFTLSYSGLIPIAPQNCGSVIANWAGTHGEENPILCDTDLDGNNRGDISDQYWDQPGCGGTPQNIYVDQGHTVYARVCGAQTSVAQIEASVNAGDPNPETCE